MFFSVIYWIHPRTRNRSTVYNEPFPGYRASWHPAERYHYSIQNSLEGIKRDAFPSGHTAVTLVVLCLAYRFQKTLFWFFLPFVLALIAATVYLRYHYVIDVVAGIVLSVLTVFIGEKYFYYWEKKNVRKNAEII